MPLLLETPKQTGDLDPNTSQYDYVKIIITRHNALLGIIEMTCQYGNDDGYGTWTAGIVSPEVHTISNDDYFVLLFQMPEDGETAYQAVSRVLYEYLVDQGIYDGEYV